MITQSQLKEVLHYNKDTGIFTWIKSGRGIPKSRQAGSVDKYTKYIYIRINKKNWSAHRLAWLYIYGEWPKNQIDHINHNRADNRIKNLRDVTIRENALNRKYYLDNNNLVGAYYRESHKKWCASITIGGIRKHIGYYNTKEEANNAYLLNLQELSQ